MHHQLQDAFDDRPPAPLSVTDTRGCFSEGVGARDARSGRFSRFSDSDVNVYALENAGVDFFWTSGSCFVGVKFFGGYSLLLMFVTIVNLLGALENAEKL